MSHGNGHFWVSGPLKSIVKHRILGLGKRVNSLNCAKTGGLILTTYTSYDVFLYTQLSPAVAVIAPALKFSFVIELI